MSVDPTKPPSSEADEEEPQPEFRDTPTSDGNSEDICYFDVVLWISDQLVGVAEVDTWDEAERQIRRLCERGDLVAHGYKYGEPQQPQSPIPIGEWRDFVISSVDGQPPLDVESHGGREYGAASWMDQEGRLTPAWTGLCFRKRDVLQHWPEGASALGDFGSSSQSCSRFASPEAISDAMRGNAVGQTVSLETASTQTAAEESIAFAQRHRRRGSPVQYPTDEPIIAHVLAVLEREPGRPVAPLIHDAADALGCSPTTADELGRLIDRVTRKVRRQQQRRAEQRPD